MIYLIDTHILIWLISGNTLLSKKFVSEIDDPTNNIFLCNVSLWEIALKVNFGKLNLGIPFTELESFLKGKEFLLSDFSYQDLAKLTELPRSPRT